MTDFQKFYQDLLEKQGKSVLQIALKEGTSPQAIYYRLRSPLKSKTVRILQQLAGHVGMSWKELLQAYHEWEKAQGGGR